MEFPRLQLKAVMKSFGHEVAVKDISFAVNEGEFFTLLGPSGCGKSTILRIIAGILRQDSGEICLDGEDISAVPPYKRPFGMVFQNYALFPHMNIFDNIAFGLKVRKEKRKEIKNKVRKVLELIKLQGYEKKYSPQLSGGQQQRVAIARCIVLMPLILLFDEPLSNLDAKLRQQMRIELKNIQKKIGVTSLYVTHDQAEALSMSDRICAMSKAKIEQVGVPGEIYKDPKTWFVADFIGQTNRFDGIVAVASDSETKVKVGNDLILCESNRNFKKNERVILLVRPEHIRISPKPVSSDNVYEVRIENNSYMGSKVEYRCRLGDWLVKVDTQGVISDLEGKAYIGWDKEFSHLLKGG